MARKSPFARPALERVVGAGAGIWFYLGKALLPLNLLFVYPQWQINLANWRWWLPLASFLMISIVLFQHRFLIYGKHFLLAWCVYCAALIPVLGFADVGFAQYSLVADHYQYIALAAVAALVAASWATWQRRAREGFRWLGVTIAGAVVALLTLATCQQSQLYRNPVSLYTKTLQNNPTCWLLRDNLGLILLNMGRTADAIEQFHQTLLVNPDYPLAHNNLALALRKSGQLAEAVDEFHRALKIKPDYAKALNNLGNVLDDLQRNDEAIANYQKALEIDPQLAEVHLNLSLDLVKAHRYDTAIVECKRALQIKSDYTKAATNMAIGYAALGDLAHAIDAANSALAMAQAQRQTALASQLQEMLDGYRRQLAGQH